MEARIFRIILCILLLKGLFSAGFVHAVMPLPTDTSIHSYPPTSIPVISPEPSKAKPIGVGPVANGQDTLHFQVQLGEFSGAVDIYLAIYSAGIHPTEFFLFDEKGALKPFSTYGYVKWKSNFSDPINENPVPAISVLVLPPGNYSLYLLVSPVGSLDTFFLWITSFDVINTEPYLDIVIDNSVIDFGRLDGVRRNQGIGLGTGVPANHPIPFPNILYPITPAIPNWGVYRTPPVFPSPAVPPPVVSGVCPLPGTASPELVRIPILPPALINGTNHFSPIQYPWGMTMVYAIVADADLHPIDLRFILPEPIMGKGNLYTAIPTSQYPIGTLIDSYEMMNTYNAALSYYANLGWLPVQPHLRNGAAAGFVSPIEPSGAAYCRSFPREFPYVIGFRNGHDPDGTGIKAGDVVTESPNPLGLTPQGMVFKVFVKQGEWTKGNASGYLWMIPVDNDFWDPRHSNQIPALFVSGVPKAICSFVGQALPIIWEAPDDPDIEGTTHDRRHVDPGTIPAGGVVYLQAQIKDAFGLSKEDSEWVAYPENQTGTSNPLEAYTKATIMFGINVQWETTTPGKPEPTVSDPAKWETSRYYANGGFTGNRFSATVDSEIHGTDANGQIIVDLDPTNLQAGSVYATIHFPHLTFAMQLGNLKNIFHDQGWSLQYSVSGSEFCSKLESIHAVFNNPDGGTSKLINPRCNENTSFHLRLHR